MHNICDHRIECHVFKLLAAVHILTLQFGTLLCLYLGSSMVGLGTILSELISCLVNFLVAVCRDSFIRIETIWFMLIL